MRSLFANLRTLTLPFGMSAGLRIVLDGVDGAIRFYNALNELRGQLTPDVWWVGDPEGNRVQLDPQGGIRVFSAPDGHLSVTVDPTQGVQVRDPDSGVVQATLTHRGVTFTSDDGTETVVMGETAGLQLPRYAVQPTETAAAGVATTPAVAGFGPADLELRHGAVFDPSYQGAAGPSLPIDDAAYTQLVDDEQFLTVGGSELAVGVASRQPAVPAAARTFTATDPGFRRAMGTTVVVEGDPAGPAPTVRSVATGLYSYTAVTTQFDLALGAVQPGDAVVAFVTFGNDGGSVPASWTTPKGYEFLGGQFAATTNTLAVGAWAKLAQAGEPTTATVQVVKAGPATPTQVHWAVIVVANPKLLPPYTDLRVHGRSVPRGRVIPRTNSSGPVTLGPGTTSPIMTLPGTAVTVTNTTGGTRRYEATAGARFDMFAGGPGIYRVLVTDNAGAEIAGSTTQLYTNRIGAAGAVGGVTSVEFTLPPGGSQVVGAGGQRISGGNSSDTIATGYVYVTDIGE